ncbi:MAG: CoA transferase [Bryobacterales bacterium]|nr:CoA transferase [Bryobacterales bacterium]
MSLLNDLLIVDFSRAVAGPFATMMLADLGARVIKVEDENTGDETRQWGPPFLDGESTYFLSMNRNKEFAALNLKSAEGRALALAMAAQADVVVENFRPGVAARLGIGSEELAARNPRLIYASVSGFGQTGPLAQKGGYDLILQAMSGSMQVSASPEQGAVKVAFPVADILAALFVQNAILAAVHARARDGRGRRIEVSLLEGMLAAMSNLATGTLNTGREPRRVGTAQPNIVPYQLFHCRDAPIVLGAPNERLWAKLCKALEKPEWLADPRFQGNALRNQHREEVVASIEAVLATNDAAHWVARLEAFELPCGPVLSLSEALAQPQVAARAAVVETGHGKLGKIRLIANPMRISGHTPPYRAPRAVGADTGRLRAEFLEPSQS